MAMMMMIIIANILVYNIYIFFPVALQPIAAHDP
jgi:hypothetical protein